MRRIFNTPQAQKQEGREALIRAIAWQIAKDRGYSNAVFALPEAISVVATRERKANGR